MKSLFRPQPQSNTKTDSCISFNKTKPASLLPIFLIQISYFFVQVIEVISCDGSKHPKYHLSAMFLSLGLLIFTAFILLLCKYSSLVKKTILYFGIATTLLHIVGVCELFIIYGDSEVYYSQTERGILFFQVTLTISLMRFPMKWYRRTLIILGCSSYILLRNTKGSSLSSFLGNGLLSLCLTLVFAFDCFKAEKSKVKKSMNNKNTLPYEKILKNLLDGLPEGIMIMDKSKKPFYINEAMNVVLGTEPSQGAITSKIEELHLEELFEEIERIRDNCFFDEFIPNPVLQSKKTSFYESPDHVQETNFVEILDPILKKRTKSRESVVNPKLSPHISMKTFFWPSQQDNEVFRSRANTSTQGSPLKRNTEHSKLRLREESIHSVEQIMTPTRQRLWKKSSSGIYPIEASFRREFDEKKFKGYAANPAIAQDYILFNLYGQYFKYGQENGNMENVNQNFAYEVKMRQMVIEDQEYKVLIITDISIREQLANLEANSKYKNLVFASLSHELRTPLNGIHSMIEVAIKHIKDLNIIKSYLEPALINAQLLRFLINDMLDYSKALTKKLTLDLQSFSLKECFQEIIELMEPQILIKNLTFELKMSKLVPKKIMSDKIRIQQVLVNLLSNAIKFTSNGRISILVEAEQIRSNIISIVVEDTGVGLLEIDKQKLSKLIHQSDITERISRSSTGIGMGLMMSQSLALALGSGGEENNGIKIQSEFGKGSSFEFKVYNHTLSCTIEEMLSIPTLPDERSPESRKLNLITTNFDPKQGIKYLSRSKSARSKGNLSLKKLNVGCHCPKILIVDDTSFNVMALRAQLEAMGIKTDATYNGQEAINKITEEKTKREGCCKGYMLIFMDFNMPVLDGYETTRKLKLKMARKEIPSIIIVGCTAYTDKELLDKGRRSGMDECIIKPITSKGLEKILRDYEIEMDLKK